MSFKIFSLQLTGKIKPVETIEQQRKALVDDFLEFQKVEGSDELKAFLELENRINSDEFKNRKKEIESLQFKGSKEFNQLQEFEKLKKAPHLKKYFKVEGSDELKKFGALKDSEKLKRYYELLEYMKEGQFEKEKKEITSEVFKGSVEEKHWKDFVKLEKSASIKAFKELDGSEVLKKHEEFSKSDTLKKFIHLKNEPVKDKEKTKEFNSLKSDPRIKAYFRFEKSKKLKLYRETVDSYDLKKYLELKAYVSTDEFKKREAYLKDRKKFEKSEAYKKQQEFKQLAADAEIRFFLKFEKSALYKNYLDVKESFDLKRFRELEKITTSEEFLKQKAWLEDTKKWEKTEEYKMQQQYLEDKKKPHLVKYFGYKDSDAFDFLKNWELAFEDDFSAPQLDTEKWGTCSPVAEKLLGENYALPGDLNIFTDGKNVKTGKKLTIEVKKEKAGGKVWKMPAGFVPAEFDYTSGLISSGKSFRFDDGILEAKVRFAPVKQVVSSLFLSGDENVPRVNLVEMGTKNVLGFERMNGQGKVETTGLDISNLKKDTWYIFAIEKSGGTFTWKINDVEVLKQSDSEMGKPLQISASSLVVDVVPGSSLPVRFEVEWIKCYRKK